MSFEFDESDDEDLPMPDVSCDLLDWCSCDADDESSRDNQQDGPVKRLTLQQRRRLNPYSKPEQPSWLPQIPKLNNGTSENGDSNGAAWSTHDTPTIHEEESGMGTSIADDDDGSSGLLSPSTEQNKNDQSPTTRLRTISDPTPRELTTALARIRSLSTCQSGSPTGSSVSGGASRWPRALNLVFQNIKNDPWKELKFNKITEEEVIRHRFNPHRRQWNQDNVRVRMEDTSFNRGAMRECFRLKKLSSFTKNKSWDTRSSNYVAKRYIEDVDPQVYFEDVRLQMNAKLWAEEYNRHKPPKKVDIMQMCVLEFIHREGRPLYHLEHHIEGDYIKHNSNSGFVDDSIRRTPHALSHFTFQRSGHQLIVVDIQGVDDIYTDPQIHTACGKEYGDGNLGVRGMALFFQSHICNEICHKLGLTPFDLDDSEVILQALASPASMSSATCVRSEMPMVTESCCSSSPLMSPQPSIWDSGCGSDDDSDQTWNPAPVRRRRTTSESGDQPNEEELAAISAALKRKERPSCVAGNLQLAANRCRSRSDSGSSDCGCTPLPGMPEYRFNGPVLGRVHHEMARLHVAGRFCEEGASPNWMAALFHEDTAAELGVVEAAVELARLHLGLPPDCFQDMPSDVLTANSTKGMELLNKAARLGDRSSLLFLAQAYDKGTVVEADWTQATHFYMQALNSAGQCCDHEGCTDSLETPASQIHFRLAEMYLHGGYKLDADPSAAYDCYSEAAEEAMAIGDGKLATKCYMLAEEASALIPEGEDE